MVLASHESCILGYVSYCRPANYSVNILNIHGIGMILSAVKAKLYRECEGKTNVLRDDLVLFN